MHSTPVGPLLDLLDGRRFVALTGAGVSTESGIPDYRGPDAPRRTRGPIRYQEFVGDPAARRRYWARSLVGWPRVAAARPNPAHLALARLEATGLLAGVITQNVDRLHASAGSRRLVELHGRLDRVRCLDCGSGGSRAALQERLLALNPHPVLRSAPALADGDANLTEDAERDFLVPDCPACGGMLKPDVVFFGENVPRHTLGRAWALFEEGEALLVVGSSLTVYSGFRFVRRARREGVPVAVVNLGPTRGDALAAVRVDGRAGDVLPVLADTLAPPGQPPPTGTSLRSWKS
jgi:NAD-dependent SIR2 family protein deacetylase